MAIYEAKCTRCKEIFIPNDALDLIHCLKNDETECGGRGILLGHWSHHRQVAERMRGQQLQPLVQVLSGKWKGHEAILLPSTPMTHAAYCYVDICDVPKRPCRVRIPKTFIRRL